MALSTWTMRRIRLFGVGSPGIWMKAVFFPALKNCWDSGMGIQRPGSPPVPGSKYCGW